MSVEGLAKFEFSAEEMMRAQEIIAKYPVGREQSAVLPLLDMAQRRAGGWLPRAAVECVADMLGMHPIKVYEVASFYTMFNLNQVGKHLVQVCTTTPCWLRGSEGIVAACKNKLGIDVGETTDDGKFTLVEVECLGACVNAPLVQINDDYYEDLTPELMENLLDEIDKGIELKIGSQIGRQCSAPKQG
jgi:NADH-quinone oxidoreductase subunit E